MHKQVLLIANDSTYVFNLRREVIAAMIEDGAQVTVACEKKSCIAELETLGCKMEFVSVGRHGKDPFKDLNLLKMYAKLLERVRPDVVLTYNIKPNVYGGMACARRNVPCIINVCGLGTPVEHPGPMQILTCFLYKMGVKKAACVFFQNEDNLAFFQDRRLLPQNARFRVLPGSGVNLTAHPLLPYPEEDGTIHFLYIARLLKEKGIDILLDAAKVIHAKHPNTLFHICGGCDDEQYKEIVREAEQAGYVQYHGEQKDVTPFFAQCHCFVYPSYYPEGMSNVLLEAAASGRPAIATDRPGCRETVEDGVTGFVVPTQNTEAVIAAVERFLAMTREERCTMGLAGRKKVEREFDRQLVVQAYREEVERAINAQAGQ